MSPLALPLLTLLLAAPPFEARSLYGVELGAPVNKVQASFAPVGKKTDAATWSRQARGRVTQLTWTCDAKAGCFALPAAADFYFVDGKLASAALRFDTERAPPDVSPPRALFELEAQIGLGAPDARLSAAGRQTRYFVREGVTVAWVQDGPDTEIKLALDRLDPVGRAESVAAGAPPQGLEKLVGGKDYAAAHLAIGQRDFDLAVRALEEARGLKKASPLLTEQATLVLALALAARAQARGPGPASAADLDRARALAPVLGPDLDALEAGLGAPASQPTTP